MSISALLNLKCFINFSKDILITISGGGQMKMLVCFEFRFIFWKGITDIRSYFSMNLCAYIYIHACRTLRIYEFNVKMNSFSTI